MRSPCSSDIATFFMVLDRLWNRLLALVEKLDFQVIIWVIRFHQERRGNVGTLWHPLARPSKAWKAQYSGLNPVAASSSAAGSCLVVTFGSGGER